MLSGRLLDALEKKIDVSNERLRLQKPSTAKPGESGDLTVSLDLSIPVPPRSTNVKPMKKVLTKEDQDLIDSMPIKAQSKMRVLLEGTGYSKRLNGKANPFSPTRHRYLYLAYLALSIRGQVSKSYMRDCLITGLALKESSAASLVAIIAAIFPALGIAKLKGEIFVLL